LPLIFAAGMSLMDTLDGAFMSHAYGWAFSSPVRKVYYNNSAPSLSVAVALVIGTIELLQVTVGVRLLDLGKLGYLVAGFFAATWSVSLLYWKARRVEQRWSA